MKEKKKGKKTKNKDFKGRKGKKKRLNANQIPHLSKSIEEGEEKR